MAHHRPVVPATDGGTAKGGLIIPLACDMDTTHEYDVDSYSALKQLVVNDTCLDSQCDMIRNKAGVLALEPAMFEEKIRTYTQQHDTERSSPTTRDARYGIRVVYTICEYYPWLDSANMATADWIRISLDIQRFHRGFDEFVVLHGTDTIAYTASALEVTSGKFSHRRHADHSRAHALLQEQLVPWELNDRAWPDLGNREIDANLIKLEELDMAILTSVAAVVYLLSQDASVHMHDRDRRTLLLVAVARDHHEVTNLLMRGDAHLQLPFVLLAAAIKPCCRWRRPTPAEGHTVNLEQTWQRKIVQDGRRHTQRLSAHNFKLWNTYRSYVVYDVYGDTSRDIA
ncbi:L-asparaginase-like [Tropilaelaps mercedesae]|uniref:L-asparaginase-like n=1 Tax=Tropilaelaps mercedesae TaxID=418985 RepID=A0A1V9XWR8_9ACAR|nr:L-asparaginase-like [Tropilaelaps mercedesae]